LNQDERHALAQLVLQVEADSRIGALRFARNLVERTFVLWQGTTSSSVICFNPRARAWARRRSYASRAP